MNTPDRIQLLAEACAAPCIENLLGKVLNDDLSDWLTAELGHSAALDAFHPHGDLLSKAVAPTTILHIVSGNTPHAAIQSIVRGVLLGSHNIIKLPSSGLPEIIEALRHFPEKIRSMVEFHAQLTEQHWHAADAVIAIGSDASILNIQRKIRPRQLFIPHGHKVSIGIAYDDFANAAHLAARDISLYNQQGCLSPHAIYVQGNALEFANLLAKEMESATAKQPPTSLSISEAGAIRNLRETTRFLAANNSSYKLWESAGSLHWTVILEPDHELKLSCLNRCVYVKPLPATPDRLTVEDLGSEALHLSTIAIHPFDRATAESLTQLPAHRICPLGQSQQPSLFWHHDGFAPLASLVKWKDIG